MNETAAKMHEAQGDTVRDARMPPFLGQPLRSWTLVMVAGGLFLAFVGATDSYELTIGLRLTLWLALCLVAGLFGLGIEAGLLRAGARWKGGLSWWLALTAGMGAAMTPVIFAVNAVTGEAPAVMLPIYLRNALVISGALVALRLLVGFVLAARPAQGDAAPPAILARLPVGLRNGRLEALASEGHYVRVMTDLGSELVLMRFGDAMRETGDVEGMQVHRSWWVARRAVEAANSDGDRLELSLSGGVTAPVSRRYRAAWRAAGWLD